MGSLSHHSLDNKSGRLFPGVFKLLEELNIPLLTNLSVQYSLIEITEDQWLVLTSHIKQEGACFE